VLVILTVAHWLNPSAVCVTIKIIKPFELMWSASRGCCWEFVFW
jgi:hypothetical protein